VSARSNFSTAAAGMSPTTFERSVISLMDMPSKPSEAVVGLSGIVV
jgi:hypothetical protein